MRATLSVGSKFLLAGVVALSGGAASGPVAAVDVTLDAATISELLDGFVPTRVEYPLIGGRPVTLLLSDVRVTGFDPAGGPEGRGQILTSLHLEVPELRLSTPVHPRVSLDVEHVDGEPFCRVRIHDVALKVPLIGEVDIARTIRPVRIPADNIYPARGARGDVNIRTRLVDVLMGTTGVRFRFDLTVSPGEAAGP